MANSIYYLGHNIFKMGSVYITTLDSQTHPCLTSAKVYIDFKTSQKQTS